MFASVATGNATPEAAVKLAALPAATVTPEGCVVTCGTVPIVSVAALVVAALKLFQKIASNSSPLSAAVAVNE